jgi:hypothetical protein
VTSPVERLDEQGVNPQGVGVIIDTRIQGAWH